MDDERIERALREGPPNEPAYQPTIGRLNATDATASDDAPTVFDTGVRRTQARVSSQPVGLSRWSAAIAAVLVILVAGFALRFGTGPAAEPTPGDLLARIKAAGVIRIAVSTEPPQTAVAGGAYIGFDVDVANAIAAKLGVRAEIQPLAPVDILTLPGSWDLAMPSTDLTRVPPGFLRSTSYYLWPSWLVVADGSDLTTLEQLAGASICVVEGSAGVEWLTGDAPDGSEVVPQPQRVTPILASDDARCFEMVASGDAEAAVTATVLDSELASSGVHVLVPDPVIRQGRYALVRGEATGTDPASFVEAVDAAITELLDSGDLAEISRRAFGGRDLSEPLR